MPGVMSWEEMNWLLPDFEETGLIYHGSQPGNLLSIFQTGIIPRFKVDPTEKHETIYDAHYRHRPDFIPDWVDPRKCTFGYMNRTRQGGFDGIAEGKVNGVTIGISAEDHITERTWVACARFSDMVYCPKEAGYFDTRERGEYFKSILEPTSSEAYWKTSLSFAENLKIRLDHLLPMQADLELLICLEKIRSDLLTLRAFRIKGANGVREILPKDCPDIFHQAEENLRNHQDISDELEAITEYTSKPMKKS